MSEEILKALTQLFAIITKLDGGVTENEREFVISFFQQELDQDSIKEYLDLYDDWSGYKLQGTLEGDDKNKTTSVKDSLKTLAICKKINKTLAQKQKVVALMKLLELEELDKNYTPQRLEIINTVSMVFNISKEEHKLIESFVVCTTPEELAFADILVVDQRASRSAELQKHVHAHIEGHLIFLRVPSVDMYFTKYLGTESNMLNSFVMQPGKVYLFSHGSTIKTQSGDALYYSDLVSNFNEEIQTTRLSFNVTIDEFRFANGAIGLRDVRISEGPGKLIGIMGASGAGKTTLLNVMAGLEKPSKGAVLINGLNIHTQKEKVMGVIGYVSQDDLLIDELTVFENLYYNARLCFAALPEPELKKLVMGVLADLGLDHLKDLKVGSVLDKTISGGQRKRLNIALELIREPAVLFLDEPTSGLSSRDSENVIDLLKELSLKGKLIFVVIHQPSSDLFKMFDKMIIMDTGGYQAYYGTPVESVSYFKKAAHQADSNRGQCEVCGNVNPEQIFNIIEAKVVDEYGQSTDRRKVTPPQWFEKFKERFKINAIEDVRELPPHNLVIPGRLAQTFIFATRNFVSKISNKQYLLINLLEAPLLAVILAFVIRYKSAPGGKEYLFRFNDNFPAFILMSIIVALFMGLTVSAEEIIRDRKILKRESFLNLSWNSYLMSKLAILFLLSAIQTLSYVLVSNQILEVQGMNMAFWLVLFSVSCFANVIGLNVSSAFNSAVTVYVLIPLLLIPQMILSGLLFSYDKLNSLISTKGKVPIVADMMASRWAYEAMAVHQFTSNDFDAPYFEFEKEESRADFKAAYLADELSRRNSWVLEHLGSPSDSVKQVITKELTILHDQLEGEDFRQGIEKLNLEADLAPATFSKTTAEQLDQYFGQYRKHYQQVYNEQVDMIEKLMAFLEKRGRNINLEKNLFHNESLSDLVKNINTKNRLIEYNGEIIQQINPIYQERYPRGPVDYRTPFFAAQKHLLGLQFGTFLFNVLVIWMMTGFFYLTLYFEWLRKLVDSFGKLNFSSSK